MRLKTEAELEELLMDRERGWYRMPGISDNYVIDREGQVWNRESGILKSRKRFARARHYAMVCLWNRLGRRCGGVIEKIKVLVAEAMVVVFFTDLPTRPIEPKLGTFMNWDGVELDKEALTIIFLDGDWMNCRLENLAVEDSRTPLLSLCEPEASETTF